MITKEQLLLKVLVLKVAFRIEIGSENYSGRLMLGSWVRIPPESLFTSKVKTIKVL